MENLERMAADALEEYHREMTLGGEPVYPQWASELQGLIKEHRVALAHNAYLEALLKQAALESPEVQALLDALEQCRFALEPYDDIKPRDWKSDRENLRRAHQTACDALAAMEKQK